MRPDSRLTATPGCRERRYERGPFLLDPRSGPALRAGCARCGWVARSGVVAVEAGDMDEVDGNTHILVEGR